VLGAEHSDTLTSMANLASTQWNQGRWTETEELEVQVMEASSRVLGAEHPFMLISMVNLTIIRLRFVQITVRDFANKHTIWAIGWPSVGVWLLDSVLPL